MWAYNLNIVYCSYSGISREFQILAYLARFNKETFGTTCVCVCTQKCSFIYGSNTNVVPN